MIFFLAAAIPLGLYWGLPSCYWNFDGVACAIALELGNPVFFFHSNHLLYGFLGYGFWQALAFFFDSLRALPALQLFSSLLSAIGLAGLCRLLWEQTARKDIAIGVTWIVSVTSIFWIWSLEAQVYPLGFVGLAWASWVLLARPSPKKYVWVGLLHGLAVLGHLIHVLWGVPALYWILSTEKSDKKPCVIRYLTTLGLTVLIPYVCVFLFVLLPSQRGLPWLLTWLYGTAGLNPERQFSWHWAGWKAPLDWLWGNLPFGWGAFAPYGTPSVSPLGWALTALSIGLFALGLVLSFRKRSPVWTFSALWLGTYALFLWTWEPLTLHYRMGDVIPLAILLALGAQTMRAHWRRVWLTALLGTTLAANGITQIGAMHRSEANTVYQQTVKLAKMTPADALYLTGSGVTWIYLLYFSGRTAWNVHLLPPARLMAEVAGRQQHRQPIFVHTSLLRDEAYQSWIRGRQFRQVAEDLPWIQLS